MDLAQLERELHKRTLEPYTPWGQKQNNHWDSLTRFIYTTPTWDALKRVAAQQQPAEVDPRRFFAYSANRWFNFWSARGVEEIFTRLDGVEAAKNPRDRLVDFSIDGIRFDHKTSVFPKRYPHDLTYARYSPETLVEWLYRNQSTQKRMHFHNRLFIILYDLQRGEHWKLRAELIWLKEKIETYVRYFHPQKLLRLSFENGQTALSDIVWAIK
jgi:hypothetical protein